MERKECEARREGEAGRRSVGRKLLLLDWKGGGSGQRRRDSERPISEGSVSKGGGGRSRQVCGVQKMDLQRTDRSILEVGSSGFGD